MFYRVVEFVDGGKSPFGDWFDALDPVTAARVDRYVRRMESGNFGTAKALKAGVFELRLHFGPGYRVYYAVDGKTVIILLGGGDKRRQASDIAAAVARWERFKAERER
jgi:putative addiction module killer protein